MTVTFPLPRMKTFDGMEFLALAPDLYVTGLLLQYSDEDGKKYDMEIPIEQAERIWKTLEIAMEAKR